MGIFQKDPELSVHKIHCCIVPLNLCVTVLPLVPLADKTDCTGHFGMSHDHKNIIGEI